MNLAGPLTGPQGQAWLSVPALQTAFERVLRNQGGPGVDGVTVHAFAHHLPAHCQQLHTELAQGHYQPQALRRVWLPKKNGGQRGLAIPAVRDRVVQCALALGLQPALEAQFEPQSYAYRPGLGVHDAVAAVLRARNEGCHWILDADIDGFFDQVSHPLMLERLSQHMPEPGLLHLVQQVLSCPIVDPRQGQHHPVKGLPQGSPLSPLLANLMLDALDEAIAARWRHVRYADDFVVLLHSPEEAQEAQQLVQSVLSSLGLQLHPGKTGVRTFAEGFEYLGARFLDNACWFEWQTGHTPTPSAVHAEARPAAAPPSPPAPAPTPQASAHATPTALDNDGADASPVPTSAAARVVPWLRTLYVLESGAYLARDGERLVVKHGQETVLEVPVVAIDIVLLFGHGVVSTPFLRFAAERGLTVAICDPIGRLHGLWPGQQADHMELQALQFQSAADAQHTLTLSRQFVLGKLANARLLMKRLHRHRQLPALAQAAQQIDRLWRQAAHAPSLDVLRGLEGAAAAAYFGAWRQCLPQWQFERRERHGKDPINQMLNLGYGVLRANVLRCAASRGLHPGVGFLHALRDGHPALVSDLMEEFRPLAVDAVVLRLALATSNTAPPPAFDEAVRKKFLRALEDKFNAPLSLPGADERLDLRRAMDAQARLLVRHLRDPQTPYRPWTAR